MSLNNRFTWIPFYEEFANKLLKYKSNRSELLAVIKSCFENLPLSYPFKERGVDEYDDIDPFTVFGSFNRGLTDTNRIALLERYKFAFEVNADVPRDFDGVPTLMNMSSWFFAYKKNRGEKDIDNLWDLFEIALEYADGNIGLTDMFIRTYDKVIKQKQVKWNITIGLYWVRPKVFLSLDSASRTYLPEFNPPLGLDIANNLDRLPEGKNYMEMTHYIKDSFSYESSMASSFYELSLKAFEYVNQIERNAASQKETFDWTSTEEYHPGLTMDDWKEFILEVELPNHPSPIKMLKGMMELGGEASCKQLSILYGGVPSTYVGCAVSLAQRVKKYFNLTSKDDGSIYVIPFLGRRDHENSKNFIYTIRPELMDALNEIDLSHIDPHISSSDEESHIEKYTDTNFLRDVYITEGKYRTCVSRLKRKKNLILQGAPGVGKTYAARRLAWSIMGCMDDRKIVFVQFHQNYSYEDFIMGYKPVGNGFELKEGIFYDFCITAKNDPYNDYFFIIDEINRGNMSKIFGELLMLIEKDYRKESVTLAYRKESFSVPENVYIIGMMNTADRSLSMIDYALRRRFSFVEMTPGFDSRGFSKYQSKVENALFPKLIAKIKALNADIETDPSLGKGFCIGHSYFCNLESDCSTETLREIVECDIIPMLEEYWFDDEEKSNRWADDLRGVLND